MDYIYIGEKKMDTLKRLELKESLKIKKALVAVGYSAGPPSVGIQPEP
jgi:hypothetical protein